jgi:formate dehydrogenase iron-sulfur subunit
VSASTTEPHASDSVQEFLTELLAEQNRLDTPVARFATAHETGPATAARHAALIPLSAPKPGEQYAFEVDLDSCTGCKSCVAACHSLNGLDDTETWRDVGLLVSPKRWQPFTQTLTTACHHCADPACLNGCPVLAYEKDPITGVVAHLDDQCIGCSYCILKCPYDVPKFSSRLGIVRKCDMCHNRLGAGEAPACAQACPTHAIRIVTVPAQTASTSFPAAAPSPDYTQPTTRYLTKRVLPETLIAGDAATLRPQPPHWPLVIMLTLLPAAVGLAAAAAFAHQSGAPAMTRPLAMASWITGAVALAASVFHLGQPLRAWRIFLGWRKSWLSREAMVFGLWFAAATLAALYPRFAAVSAGVGVLGLVCSAMIYVDTRRTFWRAGQTFPRFFGTAVVAALVYPAPSAAGLLLLAKIALESRTYYDGSVSARLQRGPLGTAMRFRDACGLVAVILLVAAPGWWAIAALVVGEMAERYLFFRAVDAPKMPGMPA